MSTIYSLIGLAVGWDWYVGLIISFGVGAAITPLFYFTRFQQTIKQVAAYVDETGLEERVVTMVQLENDNSFMAKKQRENTLKALNHVKASAVKTHISTILIVICCVLMIFCIGTVIANALIDTPLKDTTTNTEPTYTIEYVNLDPDCGAIIGITKQELRVDEKASPVQVIAYDGYVFVGWSDGVEDSYREDICEGEGERKVIYPMFEIIDENDLMPADDPNGEPDENSPRIPGTNGHPSEKSPIDKDKGENGNNGESGDGAGGSSSPNNQIIDGLTFYGNEYSNGAEEAGNYVNGNTSITGDQAGTIRDYFNNIAR